MPEPYCRPMIHPYARSKMASLGGPPIPGQLVKIKCHGCRITRYYRPSDLYKLLGDLIAQEIDRKFRCEKCGSSEYMRAEFHLPYGAEIQKITVRELAEIKMVRKPIWRDVKL